MIGGSPRKQVYLGTSNGSIVVLDVHNGSVVAQITFAADSSISSLAWNCPRFKMEEPINHESASQQAAGKYLFPFPRMCLFLIESLLKCVGCVF